MAILENSINAVGIERFRVGNRRRSPNERLISMATGSKEDRKRDGSEAVKRGSDALCFCFYVSMFLFFFFVKYFAT